MVENQVDTWCVLRTAASQTLPLAKALTDDGIAAWTPTEVKQMRARRQVPAYELTVALMPSVVFAPYDRLSDLIMLSRTSMPYKVWDAAVRRMVARGWPHFTVMRIADRYARVADRELIGLRRIERVRLTVAKRSMFRPGVAVRLIDGPGEGLRGTIDSVNAGFATVSFPGWALSMKIAFHLLEIAE